MADAGPITTAYIELRADTTQVGKEVDGAASELGDQLQESIQGPLDEAMAAVKEAAGELGPVFEDAAKATQRAMQGSADAIGASFDGLAGQAREAGGAMKDALSDSADEASSEVTGTMESLAARVKAAFDDVAASVGGSMDEAKDQADASLDDVSAHSEETAGETEGHFGGMGKVLGAAFAGFAGVEIFKSLDEAGTAANKAMAQTALILKNTGDASGVTSGQMDGLISSLSRTSGQSDEVVRSSENVLLRFTNVRNEAGKNRDIFNQASQASLNLAAAMGISVSAASQKLGMALNDPAKGLTTLRRYGVALTVQQQDQIKTMEAAGNTAGAQEIILNKLASVYGGAAAAMATPGEKLKASLDNLQDDLGQAIVPAVNELLSALSGVLPVLEPVLDVLGRGLSQILVALVPAVKALVPIVGQLASFMAGALGQALGFIVPLFSQLLQAVEPLIPPVLQLAEAILGGLIQALEPLLPPIEKVVAQLVGALQPVLVSMKPILADTVKSLGSLLTVFLPLLPTLGKLLQAIVPLLPLSTELADLFAQLATPVLRPLISALVDLVNFALEPVIAVIKAISDPLAGFMSSLAASGSATQVFGGIVHDVIAPIGAFFSDVFGGIEHVVTGAWSTISGAFTDGVHAISTVVHDGISGILFWFVKLPEDIISAIGNIAGDMVQVGEAIIHGIVQGIENLGGQVLSTLENDIPGGGLVRKGLGLLGFETGGFIPGSGPQLIVGHGGEYVLSLPQLDELRAASAATHGGPTPVSQLGFNVAPASGGGSGINVAVYVTANDAAGGYAAGTAAGQGFADVVTSRQIAVTIGAT